MQTAMIIDDDADLGQLLTLILEQKKIHAMTVQSLTEAEECLSYLKPDFIFLDNSFPDGLGVNFIRQIHIADDQIKIIMMTADTASWIEEKARDEGIHYFIRKPLSQKSIDLALENVTVKKYPN